MSAPDFPALLQSFFTDRLLRQRRASPHTVTAYRNTFRLFLRYAAARLGREPSRLEFADLDATFISAFLDHLERERSNCARSRNARLAALHAFFRYVAFTAPAQALLCQRVLAIPSKRFERGIVDFLDEDETGALLDVPDSSTWIGRRDRALLLVAIQTGLRVSELTALRRQDVTFGSPTEGEGARAHSRLRADSGAFPPRRRPSDFPRGSLIIPRVRTALPHRRVTAKAHAG